MPLPSARLRRGDVFGLVVGEQDGLSGEAQFGFDHTVDLRLRLDDAHVATDKRMVEFIQEIIGRRGDGPCPDAKVGERANRDAPVPQGPHQAHGMRDHGPRHGQPVIVPEADFFCPFRCLFGPVVDGFTKITATVDDVVHAMQIKLLEHGAAARLSDPGIVKSFWLPFDQDVADVEDHCLNCHFTSLAACLRACSSASRKRLRSDFVKPLPPPWRNGSAARRSVMRSRIASCWPMLAALSAEPSGRRTCAPASTHFAARGISVVTTTSPLPARSAIHLSASSGPSATICIVTSGLRDGRKPLLATSTMRTPCRVATFSASDLTGQASASMYTVMRVLPDGEAHAAFAYTAAWGNPSPNRSSGSPPVPEPLVRS